MVLVGRGKMGEQTLPAEEARLTETEVLALSLADILHMSENVL